MGRAHGICRRSLARSFAGLCLCAGFAAGCRSRTAASASKASEAATAQVGQADPVATGESHARNDPDAGAAADSALGRPELGRAREPDPRPESREFEAPAVWESLSDLAFERGLDGWLPSGEVRRTSEGTLADLRRALDGGDVTAVRAAVMLARTRDPRAGEVLLARLEERVGRPPGESERDAADVVAAAAFSAGMKAREAPARLSALAVGKRPHPSISVRVECARSAVALGRDEPIPYLLGVLREGTTAGRARSKDVNEEDLAWAQVRAAEALAARAGTTSRFRPEASVKEREEEAARLESLLPSRKKRG